MNNEERKTDFLIIGQGLAGTLVSYFLMKENRSLIMIDEEKEFTSSKVCGGMYTPVSGKRMTKPNGTDEQIEFAKRVYAEIENYFGIKLLYDINMYTIFGSVKEQNDLHSKLDNTNFSGHINIHPVVQENVKQPYGAFEISGSGHLDVPLLLSSMRRKLISENKLLSEKFNHDSLSVHNGKFEYKNIVSDHIIFCEGIGAANNIFFPGLPFKFCKGDVLTIKCEGLTLDRVIKKGIGIAAIGNDLFKVGATYEWNDLSEVPNENGKMALQKKLDDILELPYEVVEHIAAVRPTTRTRQAIATEHPEHKNMFMLNGLGTKGVINGPWWVKKLLHLIS